MNKFDFVSSLKDIGVSEKDTQYINDKITGSDMVNLVLILNKSQLSDSYDQAWEILSKYGIQPTTQECYTLDREDLLTIMEWLKENNTEFEIVNNGIRFKNLTEKQTASLIGEIMNEGKDSKKAKKDLEDFLAKTPRNPFALQAQLRTGAGVHKGDKKTNDTLGRNAKYKKDLRNYDEGIDFAVGDTVMFEDQEAVVKIANGPDNTIGIVLNNELRMVSKSQIDKLNESVIGFGPMDSIGRLKELAGIRIGQTSTPTSVNKAIDEAFDDIGLDNYDGLDVEDDDYEINQMGAPETPVASPAPTQNVAPVPSVPTSALPLTPPTDVVAKPTTSQAYGQILDHLNNIQNCLSDIRLSEYRSLIQKLEDLTTQVKNMGRDYLGEAAKKNIR